MLKNYWKTTLRHLKSIYSLINLLGLTVSLSVFVLIYVWVDDELSFDKFHEGHERIYRVIQDRLQPDGSFNSVALLPPMLHDYILANNKQVEEA
ncbi:MAG: ABC transporter permease, partial [Bacteroidetes bacterium]|nr:ABC transporter permease [Bacteroidota bacterium]